MSIYSRLLPMITLFWGAVPGAGASAQSGEALVQQQCAACHALQPSTLGVQERMDSKGPALFYAGTKYREDWIIEWLQEPERIRPGGMFVGHHTVVTDEGDEVAEDTLQPHIKLSLADASAAAAYLMTLTAKADLLGPAKYVEKPISYRMGSMNFDKFKGCSSCHQDEPERGGVSGPELYTAFVRLKPEFLMAYIHNPVVWEGISLMPHVELKSAEVQKLTDYLRLITEEE